MTTKTYRLPDGTEAESVEYSGDPCGWWEFRHPTLGRVRFPGESLTLLPPPLPPEPKPGAYLVRCGDAEWLVMGQGNEWIYMTSGGVMSFRWPEWCEQFPGATLTRLVPAPEPVTLPWHGRSDLGRELIVAPPVPESRYQLVPLAVNGTATTVAPGVARAMAAALLSAAEQAERAS